MSQDVGPFVPWTVHIPQRRPQPLYPIPVVIVGQITDIEVSLEKFDGFWGYLDVQSSAMLLLPNSGCLQEPVPYHLP